MTGDLPLAFGHLLLPALAAHVHPNPADATRRHRVTTTAGSRVVPLASSDPRVVPLPASAATGPTVTRSLPPSPPCRKVLRIIWRLPRLTHPCLWCLGSYRWACRSPGPGSSAPCRWGRRSSGPPGTACCQGLPELAPRDL